MAIDAGDFDCGRHFTVDVPVAVIVLLEMAVNAMHADIHVHRAEVHRFFHLVRILVTDGAAVFIKQGTLAIALEHGAEIPAVAVVIGELGIFQFRIQFRNIGKEFRIAPFAANRRAFGIAVEYFANLGGGRVFLFFGPHERGIRFVIPHGVAVETVHENVRLMHMANHAL